MNSYTKREINKAIQRALDAGLAWQPVFADVLSRNGEKVGHIVSDGYTNKTWSFYPHNDLRKARRLDYTGRREQKESGESFRREVHNKPLEDVIPKWATPYQIENIQTYRERRDA